MNPRTSPLLAPILALLLTATMAGCAASPTRESTGEYIDDATITTRVKSAFVKDEEISALDIKVNTFKGKVQLAGFADDTKAIRRAEDIARSVPGVKEVENDIHLKAR